MTTYNPTEEQAALLRELADEYGVSTHFWDYHGQYRQVDAQTIVKVLVALGVELSDAPELPELTQALTDAKQREWSRVLPATTILRSGHESRLPVHVPHGTKVWVHVDLEDGSRWELSQADVYVEPREVNGQLTGRATFTLPANLPEGYHTVVSDHEDGSWHKAHLIVVPEALENELFEHGKAWGVAAQLYSVMSEWGWGEGDAADLADLLTLCAEQGADFLLINPLHAAEPKAPISDSPYLPVTRRFTNPAYIRPEWIPEVASLSEKQLGQLRAMARKARRKVSSGVDLIDREDSWALKRQALEIIYRAPRSIARQGEFERFVGRGGQTLKDYAFWCALQENKDTPGLRLSFELQSEYSEKLREELQDQINFHCWLQWIVSSQLKAAQQQAKDAGMRIGVMHDLAVGVHPFGAARWCNPEFFASHMSVGAPPDMYNQQGQNWSQPPWSPTALEECGYQPMKQMLRAVLAHAGGIRIDHILGLFRLWWIPSGHGAGQGTYVRYDHEAMVGVLLLEAKRAGVTVIGEDLGTVEPWVRDYLADRGVLGTSVLWFERGHDGQLLYPDQYRRLCLATVNTHDLPPTLGYLRGEHTKLRAELGLLEEPLEEVQAADQAELNQVLDRLKQLGLLPVDSDFDEEEIIVALHQYIARTPALLTAVSLTDAVGEVRAQNQPGTYREYPNWRMPLSDQFGKLVKVQDLKGNERFQRLLSAMNAAVE
ncbi:4-alpha-glucanotransferase [Boudabousia liubingyangii]|uniref:4-alpha-glucanotransferase n=1 Tax=Boudabousia liubingyangii TaxID=1921764 RepID=UPI00093BDD6C|nr:4-alpha-glucanotransferase [Boudabousia liubingyangii]OKL47425.1 4-alpha-glucanotransferase [Boudabousia liubingyangii]